MDMKYKEILSTIKHDKIYWITKSKPYVIKWNQAPPETCMKYPSTQKCIGETS